MTTKKEVRNSGTAAVDEGTRRVSGCAIRFNSVSQDLGGWTEMIHPGAVTQETLDKSDIYARLDHRDDSVLARSRYGVGSLQLDLQPDGLYYSFEAPNTADGDRLLEHLRRGEITCSSFCFSMDDDASSQRWDRSTGELRRDIYHIDRLYDVSPVFEPAYLATSAANRSKEMVDEVLAKEGEIKAQMADIRKSFGLE